MKPPVHLNALRAFEASARHQSFALAARELGVTPAAVGQLVRKLEDWLGTPLFIRSNSGKSRLVATETALTALPALSAGFQKLAHGLELLQMDTAAGVLTVTVSPAFAAKWLLPRFERFHAVCPDTDVRLEVSLTPVDFASRQVDIGVRYGTGSWPGLVAEKLMDEEVFPVCSPELLKQLGPVLTAGQLVGAPLIHDLSMDGHADFPGWGKWFAKAGITDIGAARVMKINNSAAVLQAAMDGSGIALARSVMAHDDLAAGRLVRLLPGIRHESRLAYHVVYPARQHRSPQLIAFRDWLLEESTRMNSRNFC